MLKGFGNMIFHNYVSPGISNWIYSLGLEASSWGTAAIANTWLGRGGAFQRPRKDFCSDAHSSWLNDQVCLYPLALAQKERIRSAKLVPFECCGHFLFYDQLEKFNKELLQFIEE
jgi:non-heme chloroperoxidase